MAREFWIGWPDGETPEVIDDIDPNDPRGAIKFVEKSAYEEVCKQRDDFKYLIESINKRLMPRECDSVDGMLMIIEDRDQILKEAMKMSDKLEEISKFFVSIDSGRFGAFIDAKAITIAKDALTIFQAFLAKRG